VKLLLDEMHAPAVAAALVERGWDVTAVAASADLRGLPDEDLLARAAGIGAALVTENVVDFTLLATRWAGEGRPHAGLVFTNPRRFHRASAAYPANLIAALRTFLESSPVEGASWIWWL
jgi:hypothetical protein